MKTCSVKSRSKLCGTAIKALVMQYDISCVVIDCAPGANPYTAAAATLTDVPLFIGRNETATYEKIRVLPERFREWYSQFQPAKQRVIINAVSVKDLYEASTSRRKSFGGFMLLNGGSHWTTKRFCGIICSVS